MMDNEELAQAIVKCGVGGYSKLTLSDKYPYGIKRSFLRAEDFVRDGRVCLALMEKVRAKEFYQQITKDGSVLIIDDMSKPAPWYVNGGESLAIAINTACVKALEGE